MKSLNHARIEEAEQLFGELKIFVMEAAREGKAIALVEKHLWVNLLLIGLALLRAFVEAQGTGDVGETFELPSGRKVRRLEESHGRRYVSVFGEVTISRVVYGTRETQKIEAAPLDARLELPESDFSYLLQNWDQQFCVQGPFGKSSGTVEAILGVKQSVRSLEQMNQTMAKDAEDFVQNQPAPSQEEEGTFLVLATDHKGVPMRRKKGEGETKPDADEGTGDENRRREGKTGRKRMACVGAAYTIDPFIRTPKEIVEDLHREKAAKRRPQPRHKEVRAELECDLGGEVIPGRDFIYDWLSAEIKRRNAGGKKKMVLLTDGEPSLENSAKQYFPQDVVLILDLFHPLEKLWDVAHCFHADGTREAEAFVDKRLLMMLEGKVVDVVRGLRQMATKNRLTGEKEEIVHGVSDYFYNNKHRMKYNEYMAAGYPIGSGAVEGACKNLVKDRMERTGMGWSPNSAQSMLTLRAIYLNGQWESYCQFRMEKERHRLYPYKTALGTVKWPLAA